MNTNAIRQAIRLYHEPDQMADSITADAPLPAGITDLLRLCASQKLLDSFSREHDIDPKQLKQILLSYIEQVLLRDQSNPYRTLGADQSSNQGTLRLHYQLLMKIFHPDRNSSRQAQSQAGKVNGAYKAVQKLANQSSLNTIKIDHYRQPKSFYNATALTRKQLNQTRNALLFFSLVSLALIFTIVISNQQFDSSGLIVRSDTPSAVEPLTNSAKISENITLRDAAMTTSGISKPTIETSINLTSFNSSRPSFSEVRMQQILADLENAYENGDVDAIKPVIANVPAIRGQSDSQLKSKLTALFSITDKRKMVLYDFSWQQKNNQIIGKGRFLSRYVLLGEQTWLTRTGNALLTAKIDPNNRIVVTGLEMSDLPEQKDEHR